MTLASNRLMTPVTRYRSSLPQLAGGLFITDGGLETTLLFHRGLDLPQFAAFDLLRRPGGPEMLQQELAEYVTIAHRLGAGLVMESPTWRASRDWADMLGWSKAELASANRDSIALVESFRRTHPELTLVISGNLGPRGDGYVVGHTMTVDEAQDYHAEQVEWLAETAADMISAFTLGYPEEAIGVVRAAARVAMPVVIAFTVETDGRLPNGQRLAEAIAQVDDATDAGPAYFMINCAHPSHFAHLFEEDEPWQRRLRGMRVNASKLSHAELNDSTALDAGNPEELGTECAALVRRLPWINVLGGCCGTDARHVARIAEACGGAVAKPPR